MGERLQHGVVGAGCVEGHAALEPHIDDLEQSIPAVAQANALKLALPH